MKRAKKELFSVGYGETLWKGGIRDLVSRVAASDARQTFVDARTGAKIRINLDDEGLFYIEYGDNLYDAYNEREAVAILSNIRKGKKYPDMSNPIAKTAWKYYGARELNPSISGRVIGVFTKRTAAERYKNKLLKEGKIVGVRYNSGYTGTGRGLDISVAPTYEVVEKNPLVSNNPTNESERIKIASDYYHNVLVRRMKEKQMHTNINVLRDLIASNLQKHGLFRNYEAARKWSTNWLAKEYDFSKDDWDQNPFTLALVSNPMKITSRKFGDYLKAKRDGISETDA